MSSNEAREQAAAFNEVYQNIKAEVGRMMVGQEDVIEGGVDRLVSRRARVTGRRAWAW